ncbi:hypothetical protein V5O48_013501 [Marasmius crinis-equi]|uniref:Protein kinase domain-containing protein n=1 Tax=Marasmius crinis-equi TaxID=585013 RepID=A0ABR3EZW0_9AGAR
MKVLPKMLKELGNEVLIWRQLRHPNIHQFLGVTNELFEPSYCIVSPWMANGDIMAYSRKQNTSLVAKVTLLFSGLMDLQMSEMSQGIRYLHEHHPPIIHSDIKGINVLISDDGHCRITDFGLSTIENDSHEGRVHQASSQAAIRGSVPWLAPELMNPGKVKIPNRTTRDIYALGCTIYELLTGEIPFCEKRMDFQIIMAVLNGSRPPRPENCPDALWQIIEKCWTEDALVRPSASAVASELGRIDAIQPLEVSAVTTISDVSVPVNHTDRQSAPAVPASTMERDGNSSQEDQWLPEQTTHLPIPKRILEDVEISNESELGRPKKRLKIHVPATTLQPLPTQTDGVGRPTSLNTGVYSRTEKVLKWLEEYEDNHLRLYAPDTVSVSSSPSDLSLLSASYSSAIITENDKAIENWIVKARGSSGEFDGLIGVSGRMSKKYSEDLPSSGEDEEAMDAEAASGTLDLQGQTAKNKHSGMPTPGEVENFPPAQVQLREAGGVDTEGEVEALYKPRPRDRVDFDDDEFSGDPSDKLLELDSDDADDEEMRMSGPISTEPSLLSTPRCSVVGESLASEEEGTGSHFGTESLSSSLSEKNKHSGMPTPGEEAKNLPADQVQLREVGADAEGEVEALYKPRPRDKVDFDDDKFSGDLPDELLQESIVDFDVELPSTCSLSSLSAVSTINPADVCLPASVSSEDEVALSPSPSPSPISPALPLAYAYELSQKDLASERTTSSSASQISELYGESEPSLESVPVRSSYDCDWDEASCYPRYDDYDSECRHMSTADRNIVLRDAWQRFQARVGFSTS